MHKATIVEQTPEVITIQLKVKITEKSMLKMESQIQDGLNVAGNLLTGELLKRFDTDGKGIVVNNEKMTVRYRGPEKYQTSFGEVEIERNVYQTSAGGKTYCPLEVGANVILSASPRFAKILSYKYGEMSTPRLIDDLAESSNREIARSFVQNISEAVGTVLIENETTWEYDLPKFDTKIDSISIGLDGTTMAMREDEVKSDGTIVQTTNYREAMVGTIAFFDKEGERLHTIFTAAPPESGKETFLKRLDKEIVNIKAKFPRVTYLGIADGARLNWEFLIDRTDIQVLDFYHATEYITKAGEVLFKKENEKYEWISTKCHELKHDKNGAIKILDELKGKKKSLILSIEKTETLDKVITYFTNQLPKMDYFSYRKQNYSIGSGITEAAAKTVIKQRMCNSGMKWKNTGAAVVLSIRSLSLTKARWDQAWNKIDEFGFEQAA